MAISRCVFLIVALAEPYTMAQVSVTQGDPIGPTRLHSPMVVQAPFDLAKSTYWSAMSPAFVVRETKDYVCDGVTLLAISFKAEKPRGGVLPVTITPYLFDEPGVDKRVDVTIQIRRGEQVVQTIVARDIEVEESKTSSRPIKASLKTDALALEPLPVIKIRVDVRDDP